MPGPTVIAHGVAPRSTLASASPMASRFNTYISSAGVQTGESQESVLLFNDTGTAATKGRPYILLHDGDEEENPKAAVPVTTAASTYVVVALENVANQAWGWYAWKGYVDAEVDGVAVDVAVDDYLLVATAGVAFTNNTTTRTAQSAAIACEANTGAAAPKKIFLLGDLADVTA